MPADPGALRLFQNLPNPFCGKTTIRYQLRRAGQVHLTIYNVLGQAVRRLVDRRQDAGVQSATWDCRTDGNQIAANGLYFYTLSIGGAQVSRKMIVLR